MAKNIVVCCDGTSNQFTAARTNVVKRAAPHFMFATSLLLSWPAGAVDLTHYPDALKAIRDTAIAVCPAVATESNRTVLQAQASATAELPGLWKKLLNLGFGVDGKVLNDRSQGLLQKDLVTVMVSTLTCRIRVLEILQKSVQIDAISTGVPIAPPAPDQPGSPIEPAPRLPPSQTSSRSGLAAPPESKPGADALTVRVFLKNNVTSTDVAALQKLLPQFHIVIGTSAIEPRFAADTLIVNRDRVTPAEVLQIAWALSQLGVPIRSIQQSPIGGRKEVQVGTYVDPDDTRQIFQSTRPLNLNALRQLSDIEFWKSAFNGVVLCRRRTGFANFCSMDDSGRPVPSTTSP